jgi:DNA-binding NtrC family response regulator
MEPSSAFRPSRAFDGARQCVLVVEDELLIRTILSDELRGADFHVIEAFNGDEAVAILKSVVPDLIITDVRMPGSLDGMGLFGLVRDSFPTLPVIITSGHLRPDLAINDPVTQFVAKPYSMEFVVKAVQDKLGRTP